MSWILEMALALCLLMIAGGFSVYLMTPGNKKPSGSTVGIFLAVAAVGFVIWALTSERWNLLPGTDNIPELTEAGSAGGMSGEGLKLFLDNQRRLESAAKKLEGIADQARVGSIRNRSGYCNGNWHWNLSDNFCRGPRERYTPQEKEGGQRDESRPGETNGNAARHSRSAFK